jgi:hypothetical protein
MVGEPPQRKPRKGQTEKKHRTRSSGCNAWLAMFLVVGGICEFNLESEQYI